MKRIILEQIPTKYPEEPGDYFLEDPKGRQGRLEQIWLTSRAHHDSSYLCDSLGKPATSYNGTWYKRIQS